jgi:hypothetical protein
MMLDHAWLNALGSTRLAQRAWLNALGSTRLAVIDIFQN